MAEEAGQRFDVGTVIKNVDCEGVAGAVPGYIFRYACAFDPTFDGFVTHLVGWQFEDEAVFVFILCRFSDKGDDFVAERDDDTTGCGVTLVLFCSNLSILLE